MKILVVLYVTMTVVQITLARFPDPSRKKTFFHKPWHYVGEKLFLTPHIEENNIQDARKAAEVHLDDFHNVTSYSGYLTVDKENNANLFFWFFLSANNYADDLVLLWLQGGPGSSSLFGLFDENGPFAVINGSIALRDFSWHKNYSVLYIDQPVGTGFSFTEGKFVTEETQVAEHLYSALTQFFTLFPEMQKNEFYLTGESYAERFVPAIGYAIHQKNPSVVKKINLQGLIIGNGYSDPIHQTQYGDLLYQLGLIDSNALIEFHSIEATVVSLIEAGLFENATDSSIQLVDLFSNKTGLKNIYNYIKDVDDAPTEWHNFIIKDRIRQAIHVGNQSFFSLNYDVYDALYEDSSKSVVPWVSELLSHYRILLYSGQLDFIVPYTQTENFLQHLNFSSAAEYKTASRNIWHVGNRVAGYVKTAGNLTEVLVRNAGHIVPMDQPEFAWDLLTKFIKKQPIAAN